MRHADAQVTRRIEARLFYRKQAAVSYPRYPDPYKPETPQYTTQLGIDTCTDNVTTPCSSVHFRVYGAICALY